MALSADDHARISTAIRAAERNTSGEIYCVVARSSDPYFFPAAFMLTLCVLILGMIVALILEASWISVRPAVLLGGQLALLAACWATIGALPDLRIALTPKALRRRRAHDNAMRQFLARNVHVTAARTGVLLFVSLAERYAEVVADAGINQKVPAGTWQGVVDILTSHARSDRLADGFVSATGEVGLLLAAHFPPVPQDRNELDDHLVEI